ncbi:MAG: adenosine kinase [Spirochaetia bacterium]
MRPITGIGNPLMDIIVPVDYTTFRNFEAEPGSMNLVENSVTKKILALPFEKTKTPGGSCANTLRGIAWLAGSGYENKPYYMGAVGKDEAGDGFLAILVEQGVEPGVALKDTPTGVSGILVTPDHERTMFTHLGACRDFTLEDVNMDAIRESSYLHIAGYMWDTENQKEAAKEAVKTAGRNGVKVSFDLADPFVVYRYGDELREWLPGKVDLLFANREELSAMTEQKEDEAIMRIAREYAPFVVMKTGAEGCILRKGDEVIKIPGERVEPVDTTGAGDSFAAGFLYALLEGHGIDTAGRLANRTASRIVTIEGCNYALLDLKEILSILG